MPTVADSAWYQLYGHAEVRDAAKGRADSEELAHEEAARTDEERQDVLAGLCTPLNFHHEGHSGGRMIDTNQQVSAPRHVPGGS
eukprot:CAMPEP_0177436428 /NCGR_PEP_ID=MMETSP0369-20130122/1644_1 /TAXON_ID=447022 ORGANISM="Scrippsiella hangoei-like, Strain SHHI-4" /NCGR_SAMPLE_ID=MMETSP0369 /ASSEMBLY_ACC=CAM_ASM_000364 /LENGTH=83 /DNA_ID=CAMNT_0018907783 /DNA_START=588 /DNA_END=836 /DNA_ORIENTATION=+